MLGEPQPTQADINFRLFGIPVRVHPLFWVVAAVLGFSGAGTEPTSLLIWVAAVFVSILIHELGHALTARSFGEEPWITLYSLGGLASYRPTRHDSRSKVIISAAGPAAGFMFIALVFALIHGLGHNVTFSTIFPWISYEGFQNENLNLLIGYLWFINLFWGLVNLLPIYPLDGGQIAREFFVASDTGTGIRNSLYLSMFCAVGVAVYGLAGMGSFYLAIMFGFLAFSNYQMLQLVQGRGGPFGGGPYGGGRGW